MDQPVEKLRILLLEDAPSDAELEERELRSAGLEFTLLRVDTRAAFEQAFDELKPHIVIADYLLPSYTGREALEYTRHMHPQIPVIIVTGVLGDAAAVELLKLGARDYVLKNGLTRLAPAIKRALAEERDIRNRKLAEGKYHTLFIKAHDGIAIIDQNAEQMSDCNPEFERICGRSLDELKAMKVWELIAPDKLEKAKKIFLKILETGSASSELELQKPDGATVHVEFSSTLINIQDSSIIQVIARDITERRRAEQVLRESEEKFRAITSSAQDAILMIDNEGNISNWNAAAEIIFGYSSQEALGQELHTFLAPKRYGDDYRHGFSHFKETGKGPVVGRTIELTALKKGGVEFPIELSLSAVKLGSQWNGIGIVRDITERKRSETVIRRSLEEKDILLHEIHHRVKNNIQVILSLLRLAAGKIPDIISVGILKDVQDKIRSIALIHELLYRSADINQIDFNSYIKSLASQILGDYSSGTNIRLNLDIQHVDIPIKQATPCGLIVNELISNATKHAFPNGRHGQINISLHVSDDNEVDLVVSDNGVGIPPELNLEQLDSMGLKLIKQLAESQLQGSAELENKGGTSWRIKFHLSPK